MDYKEAKSLKQKLLKGEPIVENMEKDPFDDEDIVDEDDGEIEMECFKAGTHIDSAGNEEHYTDEDVKNIADKYNEQKATRPAPLIVGHSSMEAGKDDKAPAFGWAEEAKAVGGKLMLKFKQVPKEMKELIKSGAYRNRSISLYEDGRIRHLAVLGAAQPALELSPVTSFSDGEKYKTYEYKELDMADEIKKIEELEKEVSFFNKLMSIFKVDVSKYKDHAESDPMKKAIAVEQGTGAEGEGPAEDKGEGAGKEMEEQVAKETTEGVVPDAKIEVSKAANAETKDEANVASKEMEELKAKVTELSGMVATLSDALKAKGEEVIKGGVREFCESLIKDGLLRPVDLDATLQTFEEKAYIDSIRNYSEQGKPSSVELFKLHLKSQPKVVEFSEIVPMDGKVSVPATSFADVVADKMKAKPELSYAAAFKEACDENPEMDEVKECYSYMRQMHE